MRPGGGGSAADRGQCGWGDRAARRGTMREGGGQADGAAVRGGGGPELLLLVKAGQMDGTRACCDGRRLERRTGRGRAAMEGGVGWEAESWRTGRGRVAIGGGRGGGRGADVLRWGRWGADGAQTNYDGGGGGGGIGEADGAQTCCDWEGEVAGRRKGRGRASMGGGRGADVLRWRGWGGADGARACCCGGRQGRRTGRDKLLWGRGRSGRKGRGRAANKGGRVGGRGVDVVRWGAV